MPDPRFYRRAGPHTLAFIAKVAGAEHGAGVNPSARYEDVARLESAGPQDVSFAVGGSADTLTASRCGVCLVPESLAANVPAGTLALICRDPKYSFALVAGAFYPPRSQHPALISAQAADATIAPDAVIEQGAVIGPKASIGAGSRIGVNAVVGAGVVIGRDCWIGAHV
ncbi:MAG: UDP-3-O-(3-hydroxymyristoyl)glucosamine N-acyltransferase, partial [Alphaproteobacteria bacterium]|nr:UDP-3-O-(3-hydroxymyristoyl)glucosamine N-acyltransferase [Alphaproteobacteria bacterium]